MKTKMKKQLKLMQWIMVILFTAGTFYLNGQVGGLTNTGDQTVCLNTTEQYGVVAVAGSTYTWQILPGTGGAGTIIDGPAPNNLISVQWTGVGTCTLEVTEHITATGCSGVIATILVTVLPAPIVDNQVATVCSDIPTGVTLGSSTNGVPLSSYNIILINANGLTASAGNPVIGNGFAVNEIADDAWTNTTGVAVDVVYTVVPVSTGGCLGAPFTVTVTVNPEPVVTLQIVTVCSDVATGITLGASTNGVTVMGYNITAINANGMTASAGNPVVGNGLPANEIADDAWTNTTGAAVDVIYTIEPVGPGGCLGDPFTVTVTVNPEPVVANQTTVICSDQPTGVTLGSSTNGITISGYNITAINPNGLTASAGNPIVGNGFTANEIADDAWTNLTGGPVDVVYTVIPVSNNGCLGDPFLVTVTINTEPEVLNQTATVCSDVATGVTLGSATNGVIISGYNITAINANGLTASAGNPVVGNGLPANEIADDAWKNTTGAPVDVVYTVVPVSTGGCLGNSFIVTITINPEPVVILQTATVCSDVATGVTLGSSTNGVTVTGYNITAINANGLTASAGNPVVGNGLPANEIADDAWTNITGGSVNVVYTIEPVGSGGCLGNPFTVTITVNPEPVVANQTAAVCSDQPTGVTLGSSTNGITISGYNITAINPNGLTSSAGSPVVGNGLPANEITDDAWTNNTGGPVDVVYTVVPVSNNGCLGDPFLVTVTINTEPAVLNQTATVCSDVATGVTLGSATNGVIISGYNITAINANGLTASAGNPVVGNGLPANEIADDAWTNNTGAPVNVVYTVVPVAAGGCVGEAFTVTITINPEPMVASQTASVCSDIPTGVTLGSSTNGVPVATYNITAINPNGLTASAGSPVTGNGLPATEIADDAWTNTTGTNVDVIYTVVPVAPDGCIGDIFTVTVTIYPEPTTSQIWHN